MLQAMASPYSLGYKATDFWYRFGDFLTPHNLYHSDWSIDLSTYLLKFHSHTRVLHLLLFCEVLLYLFSFLIQPCSVFSLFCYNHTTWQNWTQNSRGDYIMNLYDDSNIHSVEIGVSSCSVGIQKQITESFFL